ncbi:SRPBCC family protein [Streptomyces tubbatahanensis]|uniref:SRPBCC family protein n=1 Tax=Streptomyces tubbatahanensis TaxID=2923272 RepID=A0ABY3XMD3_9ACTN|nr:SRPBCC family protein [Streptomyces tubbatahanensis]UNS95593.1 SRPBCC family protein [Streptomyces tubbatahanensis]
MARQLRSVGLDFADTAPLRLSFVADVAAPAETVYAALADDVTAWPCWFTAVTEVRPTRGGSGRAVRLKGGGFFDETIVAAHPSQRYAYRIDRTSAPGVRAMMEDWELRLSPAGSTRVRWTMAVDGTPVLHAALRLGRPGIRASFRDAMRKLEGRLRA